MVWPNEKMKKLDHPPQFDMFPRRPARVATVGADTWNPLSNLNSLIPDSLLPVKFNGGTCESSGVLPVDSLSEALPPAVCIESDWEHPSFPAFFWKIQKNTSGACSFGKHLSYSAKNIGEWNVLRKCQFMVNFKTLSGVWPSPWMFRALGMDPDCCLGWCKFEGNHVLFEKK